MAQFRFRRIRELVHQLMVGPPEVRRVQAGRLEELLAEFDPERRYPYEFLYFRITGFRPQDDFSDTYAGREVLPDLLRALEMLSRTVPRPVEQLDEPVQTVEQVAERFSVSLRTVRRWRRRGLVGAYYVSRRGRAFLGVRQSALDRFVTRNRPMVESSGRFSRLSADEEAHVVEAARRLMDREGLSPTAAAERVAAETDRAAETVRQALRRREREEPDQPVAAPRARRLSGPERREIYGQYRTGVRADELASRFGRSRSTIYRVINRERAVEALAEPISFVKDDAFAASDAEATILGEDFRAALDALDAAVEQAGPGEVPLRQPPLTGPEERALFRAYNYLRFRAAEAQAELDPHRYVPSRLLRRLDELEARAEAIRSRLIRLHMPLFEQVARQHVGPDAAAQELETGGRAELGRLVDSFRYTGRGRFAAHAKLELMKVFARAGLGPAEGA
jgi:AraC-like DNA-binding protein